MRRTLLLSLFAILYGEDMFGLDLVIVRGLSAKNMILYSFLGGLILESTIDENPKKVEFWVVHATFVGLIIYCGLTWFFLTNSNFFELEIKSRPFSALGSLGQLKTGFIDQYAFFLAFFLGLTKLEDATWVAKRLIWLIVVSNVVTIIDVFNIPDLAIIHQRADGRVSGPVRESNQYAAFLVFFLPSIAIPALSARAAERIAFAFATLLSATTLILTTSRGGLVGLGIGLMLGMFLLRRHLGAAGMMKIVLATAVILGIAVIIARIGFADLLTQRLVEKTGSSQIVTASSGRSEIWANLITLQLGQPMTLLCGFGYGMSRAFRWASHNTYLQWLFELGAIGLILYVSLLSSIARIARRAVDHAQGELQLQLGAFLFGFLSLCIAISFVNLYRSWFYIWAFTGLMVRVAAEVLRTAPPLASTALRTASPPRLEGPVATPTLRGPSDVQSTRVRRSTRLRALR